MGLSANELKIIKKLDDGTLYAQPSVVSAMFDFPYIMRPTLAVAYDDRQKPIGYLPVAEMYADGCRGYIAAIPGTPPISPTYTPGAHHVLAEMSAPYFDHDVVAGAVNPYRTYHFETASAYVTTPEHYLGALSKSRRKDMRRKLKQATAYQVVPGTIEDVRKAWTDWMIDIWEERADSFGTPYDLYLAKTVAWLKLMRRSPRATLRIEKHLLGSEMVGVNCCVIHNFQGEVLCDDYLCWYNPKRATGLGIVSAVRNLTHPDMQGYRYNLGTPGVESIYEGHEYKLAIIPRALRLDQIVCRLPPVANRGDNFILVS